MDTSINQLSKLQGWNWLLRAGNLRNLQHGLQWSLVNSSAPSPMSTSTLKLCLGTLQSASTVLAVTQFSHQWEHEKELRMMKNDTITSMPVLERQQGIRRSRLGVWPAPCALISLMLGMLHTPQKAVSEHSTTPLRGSRPPYNSPLKASLHSSPFSQPVCQYIETMK